MIDFVFVIFVLFLIMLMIAMLVSSYILGLLSCWGLMVVGVLGLVSGWLGYKNDLTQAFSIVVICAAFYIFMSGTLDELEG